MKVLDLFSGIGGFSLGLERAGMRTIAFCEPEPFCRCVLFKHWPDARIEHDVRYLRTSRYSFDVLCGGPPCQHTSVAAAIHGTRTGETLWPEMLRVADEGRPQWIIVEQPPGNAAWESAVASDLARIGYHVSRLQRSARARGAPHQRRRVFFVANTVRERCEEVARLADASAPERIEWPAPPRGAWRAPGSGDRRMDDGVSDWVDRLKALGNSVVPHVAEQIGRAILAASPIVPSSVVLTTARRLPEPSHTSLPDDNVRMLGDLSDSPSPSPNGGAGPLAPPPIPQSGPNSLTNEATP